MAPIDRSPHLLIMESLHFYLRRSSCPCTTADLIIQILACIGCCACANRISIKSYYIQGDPKKKATIKIIMNSY